MADPATYRPAPGEIPDSPGVYRFRDEHGRVIYVGKAKSLRSRLNSYFQDVAGLHQRTQQMVTTAASVQWTVVGTEVEALALEYSWIKEFDPRFNIKYRDDKSYPYLAVTMSEEFPRVQVMRGAKRPGTRYFGPYGHAWAIRETVDLLLRVFPVRTCSAGVFKRASQQGRPCLLGYIDKCSAPCVGRISPDDHKALAQDFCDFMAGDTAKFTRRLTQRMKEASADLDFERAARLRDDIAALERATEKNAVVLPDGTDADIFALVGDELEAAVQVFHVRDGRIRGQRGWVVEKVEDAADDDLVEHLLQQVYGGEDEAGRVDGERRGDTRAVPREVLVPVLPPDVEQVQAWLTGLRGSRVEVRVPQRGDKKDLAETVRRNAEHALALHRTRRAGDLTTRSQALREIQEALELPTAPLRIECYDVSHNQGTYQSASMVVFEDGLARKSEYRHFSVRGAEGDGARDDTEAMHEVITRRFRRYLAERANAGDLEMGADEDGHPRSGPIDETTGKPVRFAYPPNLVVVDGGPPQVAAAAAALAELGIDDVALCGLAKRLEEVWLPGEEYPVILQRSSEGLYLLQRVRDEAHRFAINAHRKRRSKGMTVSALDSVPGLGPARSAALLKHFGSLKRLRAASVEEIASVPGMGERTAAAVVAALATPSHAGATLT
ncbi:excinuclease ABC subunit UvrC [Cellulomonas chengniuliangii]|uniref:UvrABC system protein C n=1 Tax=Cellulomonas chengniuliangii TaxID=2968084 RepID=A0ABY5L3M2_9CELL|nr:excinuclease ABC subunit UvrC [Cellulomonas chengniuliangii]MCC2308261.1 excinuclease ABC subunit UvrC [Cellulomonas chengniuliangii]MCC2317268.1 excinuclease ABC subunit UvrC [Cellulomonas chengniuliangii]UUI76648.1 excinuclease ABC subunit UvrC [Cellulomonas chengniuliangii]